MPVSTWVSFAFAQGLALRMGEAADIMGQGLAAMREEGKSLSVAFASGAVVEVIADRLSRFGERCRAVDAVHRRGWPL